MLRNSKRFTIKGKVKKKTKNTDNTLSVQLPNCWYSQMVVVMWSISEHKGTHFISSVWLVKCAVEMKVDSNNIPGFGEEKATLHYDGVSFCGKTSCPLTNNNISCLYLYSFGIGLSLTMIPAKRGKCTRVLSFVRFYSLLAAFLCSSMVKYNL